MRYRLVCVLAIAGVVFAVTASLGVSKFGVSNAYACGTPSDYWNISCNNYAPHTGVTVTQARNVGGGWETIWADGIQANFSPYDTIQVIGTTASGNWLFQALAAYSQELQVTNLSSWTDKVGCYPHHGITVWVNCRHWDWQ
jgi:hypothetical protein